MNRFNFLVDMQHFDWQNSVKKKGKQHAVYNYSEHVQHYEPFLKINERNFALILT